MIYLKCPTIHSNQSIVKKSGHPESLSDSPKILIRIVKMEGVLCGLGNPLLDISAEVPTEVLTKYDVTLNNAILAEEKHLPLYAELAARDNVQYIGGGATQNSIRAAQWMMKPGGTAYMGAIGNDEFGAKLEACVNTDGVRVHYQKTPDIATGTCAVLVNGAERSLVANLSAANTFTAAHLETADAKNIIELAQVYYMAGFFLTVSVESVLAIGQHAVANNKTVCLNLSAPFIIQFFGDQLAAAMPYADFVFCNESEAAVYGEVMKWGTDLDVIAMKLAALPKASGTRPRIVVFTQGSKEVIVACQGELLHFPVEPLAQELIVDTNAAGDSFVGGFLSRLVEKKDIAECVRAGNFCARTVLQYSGCTFPASCDFV